MEDRDIGPDQVYLKRWADASTQTHQENIYACANAIVSNFDKIQRFYDQLESINTLLSIGLVFSTCALIIVLSR